MENTNKNFLDAFADMQKQAVENFTNAASTMQKAMMNQPNVNFDTDAFKKWFDTQMESFYAAGKQTAGNNNGFEFFNNWLNKQMEFGKQWFSMNQNNWENWNNQMKNAGTASDFNANYNQAMQMFQSWKNTMNESYANLMNQFGNAETRTNFSDLFNNAEFYLKAFELWMPFMKSIQDKSFNPEMFRQNFDFEAYQNMLDKMFNLQPDWMKNMNEQVKNFYSEQLKNNMSQGKDMYAQYKNWMNNQMPEANTVFANMMGNYQQMADMMNNAVAPFTKLMAPNADLAQMEAAKELNNQLVQFFMKNAQMQYVMYTTGTQAMEDLSESIYTKIANGEDMSQFAQIYSQWLNTNDRHFVKLFETEEYSRMMSEISSLQLKMKKNMDMQMEKHLSSFPLINRTEMDELYKTIYELKKRIHSLEKQLDTEMDFNESVSSTKETKAGKKSPKTA